MNRSRFAAATTVVLAAAWLSLVPQVANAEGPSMSLEVTAATTDVDGDGLIGVGDTIAYSFTITNTGDQDLNTFAVTADLLEKRGIAVACPQVPTEGGWLVPGATLTCTADSEYAVAVEDYGSTDGDTDLPGDEGDGDDGGEVEEPGDDGGDVADDGTGDEIDEPGDDDPVDDGTDGTTDEPGDDGGDDGGDGSCGDGCAVYSVPLVLNATATAVARDGSAVSAEASVTVELQGVVVVSATSGEGGGLPSVGA